MKSVKLFAIALLSLLFVGAKAQSEAPKGFSKGTVVLPDNSSISGFIKDDIRKDASVVLQSGGKEKKYDGAEISGVEIDGTSYEIKNGTAPEGGYPEWLMSGNVLYAESGTSETSEAPSSVSDSRQPSTAPLAGRPMLTGPGG